MIEYIMLIVGISLLLKGSDYLVEGSSSLAKKLGISTLVVGLTVVAFGTSSPELIVNLVAALKDSGDIALGNIVGSSMANTLLVLGIMALMIHPKVKSSTTWKEIPFSFLAALVLFIFSIRTFLGGDSENLLSRSDGMILLLFFIIFMYYIFEMIKKDKRLKKETEMAATTEYSGRRQALMIIGGLMALYLGGRWTVDGAVIIAETFGLSEYLISATIIAVGSSLPELAITVTSALKNKVGLGVGNIIGSNIFNIFWVLGITSIIRPIRIPSFLAIDLALLLFSTALLFTFMFTSKKNELDRWEGAVLLLCYITYISLMIIR
ncbi:MAG: calcium/sodium antiporter [Candidatus Woesearchaeota archaeon]